MSQLFTNPHTQQVLEDSVVCMLSSRVLKSITRPSSNKNGDSKMSLTKHVVQRKQQNKHSLNFRQLIAHHLLQVPPMRVPRLHPLSPVHTLGPPP